jgi:hypothetical protein
MTMTETAPAAPTTTFHVRAERGDQYWVLHVASPVDRWTQARHLREVDAMARDLIAIMLDVPADSFALDVDVIMPTPVTALLAEAGRQVHRTGKRARQLFGSQDPPGRRSTAQLRSAAP